MTSSRNATQLITQIQIRQITVNRCFVLRSYHILDAVSSRSLSHESVYKRSRTCLELYSSELHSANKIITGTPLLLGALKLKEKFFSRDLMRAKRISGYFDLAISAWDILKFAVESAKIVLGSCCLTQSPIELLCYTQISVAIQGVRKYAMRIK